MDYSWNKISGFDTGGNWTIGAGAGSVAFSSGKITFTGAAGQSKLITYTNPGLKKNTEYVVYVIFKELTGVNSLKKITVDMDVATPNSENYINGMRFARILTDNTPVFKMTFSNGAASASKIEITEIQVRELSELSYFLREDFFDRYFTNQDKTEDSFKNQENKGVYERFNLLIADEIDKQMISVIENICSLIVPVNLCREVYIPLWEENYGVAFFNDMALRRKLLNQITTINKIKGSIPSFEILFRYINSVITFTEEWEFSSFDSARTLDDAWRRFDMTRCQRNCTGFDMEVVYGGVIDAEYLSKVVTIMKYLKPINADII